MTTETMSIADELQFVLDWESDRMGAVSAGTFKAQIAAVRDLEFQQAVRLPVIAYDAGDSVRIESAKQLDGIVMWKVRDVHGNVLANTGEWEYEPLPSLRGDAFLARCRFKNPQEALACLRGVTP